MNVRICVTHQACMCSHAGIVCYCFSVPSSDTLCSAFACSSHMPAVHCIHCKAIVNLWQFVATCGRLDYVSYSHVEFLVLRHPPQSLSLYTSNTSRKGSSPGRPNRLITAGNSKRYLLHLFNLPQLDRVGANISRHTSFATYWISVLSISR